MPDGAKSRPKTLLGWLDADSASADSRATKSGRPETEPDRWLPFLFLHFGCLSVFVFGCSQTALIVAISLYCLRMFAITGFYHRYFSHRTYRTSRAAQLIFALAGATAMQRGPLWWAAHHRQHHAASDLEDDVHSPVTRSFLWSHLGWLTSSKNMTTDYEKVRDFAAYPELRFVNRFDWLMPLALYIALMTTGDYLRLHAPQLHTSGGQLVAWGFFVSTTVLFHATCSINSVAHVFGYRRFDTADSSRNNPLLALFTFGEGWHNNHHKYSHCTRQGFEWWEVDITFYLLQVLSWLGVVCDLKPVPTQPLLSAEPKVVSGSDRSPVRFP